jgi:hypothetical protein
VIKFAIVIVCFNRPECFNRLYESVIQSDFSDYEVDLIISIDISNVRDIKNEEMIKITENIRWQFGKLYIDAKKVNLGLKNHILSCGNHVNAYDYIILLEDDLVVSPSFFQFSKEVTSYYKEEDNLAGYALYSPGYNENSNGPFIPIIESDVYFMQLPCSWGQIWSKKQWSNFIDWYNSEFIIGGFKIDLLPQAMKYWSEKSWKKIFCYYLISTNKYIIYPVQSFSTNFGSKGVHLKSLSNDLKFQVPLVQYKTKFEFMGFADSMAVYDAYCENIRICKMINEIQSANCIVDLFMTKDLKRINEDYILTTKKMQNTIVKSFGLDFKPIELNIINENPGDDIFLYKANVKNRKKFNIAYIKKKFVYDYFNLSSILRYFVSAEAIIIIKELKVIFKKRVLKI